MEPAAVEDEPVEDEPVEDGRRGRRATSVAAEVEDEDAPAEEAEES